MPVGVPKPSIAAITLAPCLWIALTQGIIGWTPARAGESQALGDILNSRDPGRLLCLIARARDPSLGSPGPAACEHELRRSTFMADMAQRFCSSPRAFCGRTRDMSEHELQEFVDPDCRPAFRPGLTRDLSGEGDRVAALMMQSWGCGSSEPELIVRADSKSRPYVQALLDCDPAKMPFDCNKEGRAKPSAGTPGDAINRTAAEAAFRASGATMTRVGDRCRIFFGETPESAGGSVALPPVQAGEGYAQYSARARDQMTRDQLDSYDRRVFQVESGLHAAFNSATRLLGKGSDRFRLAARSVVTPEAVSKLEKTLQVAKDSLRSYLSSLQPPAPPAVLRRIEAVGLFRYRAFLGDPKDSSNREAMRRLEAMCRDGSDNALGHPKSGLAPGEGPGGAEGVVICPASLADLSESNPNAAVSRMLQLLSSAVTPCELGSAALPASFRPGDPASCAKRDAQPSSEQFEIRRFAALGTRYLGCVSKPQEPEDPALPPTPGPLVSDLIQAIRACKPGYNACALEPLSAGGAIEACSIEWQSQTVPKGCKGAEAVLEKLRQSPYRQQSVLAFSTYLASQAMERALKDPRLPGARPANDLEKRSDLLTTLSIACYPMGIEAASESARARGDLEVSILASNKDLRARAGCDKLDLPLLAPQTREFPFAACDGLLSSEGGSGVRPAGAQ